MVDQRQIDHAIMLHRAGRLEEAARAYDSLLGANPGDPNLLHLKGILAGQSGDLAGAFFLLRRAIEADPNAPEFRNSMAVTFERAARFEQAAAAFNDQGNLLMTARRFGEASTAFDHASRLQPASPHYRCNRAVSLIRLGQYEKAVALLSSTPDEGRLSYIPLNLGNALTGLTRPAQAIAAYDRALSLEPDLVEAHWARGQALLLTERYQEGWREYEWRTRWPGYDNPYRDMPSWQGQAPDVLGGRLLVICEQGFGDAIQFCRFVPLLAAQGYDIVFEVRDELYRLFSQGFIHRHVEIVARSAMLARGGGTCAAYVPLLSLPHHLGTTAQTIPSTTPYLSVTRAAVEAFAASLPSDGRLKIGIVRAGEPQHGNDFARSLAAADLAPLLSVDAAFHSLQVTRFEADHVAETGLGFRDFADTAAAIAAMDLVISADTSVAHLTGTLGRPLWLLLPSAPDWRWGLTEETTRWYPGARLFRQQARGEWRPVVDRVRRELKQAIAR